MGQPFSLRIGSNFRRLRRGAQGVRVVAEEFFRPTEKSFLGLDT